MIKEPILQIILLLAVIGLFYWITKSWFGKHNLTTKNAYEFDNSGNGYPYEDEEWAKEWKRKEHMAPVNLSGETYREGMDDEDPYAAISGDEDGVEGLENISLPTDENTMRLNFLSATGIDKLGAVTVSQPKRFLSNDLRKAIPNPRMANVLWNGSSIEADNMKRSLESIE